MCWESLDLPRPGLQSTWSENVLIWGVFYPGNASDPEPERHRIKREGRVLGQLCLTAAVPLIDETLQLFTPGRSGQISDVWLDMGGAAAGTVFFFLAAAALRRVKRIE